MWKGSRKPHVPACHRAKDASDTLDATWVHSGAAHVRTKQTATHGLGLSAWMKAHQSPRCPYARETTREARTAHEGGDLTSNGALKARVISNGQAFSVHQPGPWLPARTQPTPWPPRTPQTLLRTAWNQSRRLQPTRVMMDGRSAPVVKMEVRNAESCMQCGVILRDGTRTFCAGWTILGVWRLIRP